MAALMRSVRRRPSLDGQRGLALVEAALLLPVLFLLTFALIEYGWLFLRAQQITNAARQGARVAARADAVNADVRAAVQNALAGTGLVAADYTLTTSPADVSSLDGGEVLTVTISVPYENVQLTGVPFIPVPERLRAATAMAKEGP
ncbi:MAG: pilus assembly protein [Planctomycetes bacterium]|nr:pilus assembly protein [Planctomycetota bacterium]